MSVFAPPFITHNGSLLPPYSLRHSAYKAKSSIGIKAYALASCLQNDPHSTHHVPQQTIASLPLKSQG
ncbi:hypothetical protein C5167_034091, partial [Papaver somniferum]